MLAAGYAAVSVQAAATTCNASISICEHFQQWSTTGCLLRGMQQWNMKANVISYIPPPAGEQYTQWITAACLLQKMRRSSRQADVHTYNARIMYHAGIGICEKSQQWIAAVQSLREMQLSMRANVTIDNATTRAGEKCQQ